jgi:hypothetical protein
VRALLLVCTAAFILLSCNRQQDKEEEEKSTAEKRKKTIDASMNSISSSKDIGVLLCQHWEHKGDHELPYLTEDDEDPAPMRAFYFFNDGTVIKDPRNTMRVGKWVYDDDTKQIEINVSDGIKKRYKIKSISYRKLLLLEEGDQKPEEYRADGLLHKNKEDDPFYLSNIQWMIKPAAAEDDAAIRRRVKSCVHFYYLFYADSYKRDADEIFFYGLPGCFKWYAGGIYLKKEKVLGKKWKEIFFNAEDAHKAYLLLDKMMSQQYNWDKTQNSWVKQNAGVLKQMDDKINSL